MAEVLFASNDKARYRQMLRDAEVGLLTKVAPGVFVEAGEPVEIVVLRNWTRIVGHVVPDAVVTDRTGLEARPWRKKVDGVSVGDGFVFVSAPRSRALITLPGLQIAVREGVGPVKGDIPYIGTHLASPARQLLDNLSTSRSRNGPTRTLGSIEVERKLASICAIQGETHLNHLRDEARRLAPLIDKQDEFVVLDALVGALLRSRDASGTLRTPQGRARGRGQPHDPNCLERLSVLANALQARAPHIVPNAETSDGMRSAGAFIEAYFSNYIEGTVFQVGEAQEIVFEGLIPAQRPEDGHDVLSTYLQLMDGGHRSIIAIDPDDFIIEVKARHGALMSSRPNLMPGEFKTKANQAGNTVFVEPELVEGTLRDGLPILQALEDPFRRALALHFLLSDVHPFSDGNGRLSRIMMSRELATANLSRIVVPTVFRNSYLDGQRAISRRSEPTVYIRNMEFCQDVSAACASEPLDQAIEAWARAYAFCDDERHAKLSMPSPAIKIEFENGIPAPSDYWDSIRNTAGNPFKV